jgi:hypothetical protein
MAAAGMEKFKHSLIFTGALVISSPAKAILLHKTQSHHAVYRSSSCGGRG